MARYVVLLRGVNVGGHNKVPMARFRTLLGSLGHTDVATYLQSGNAVFSSSKRSAPKLANEVEQALVDELGVDVRVLVITQARLEQVVQGNPMAALEDDPTHLHVAFLSSPPDTKEAARLDPTPFAPDTFAVVGDVVYLHYPNGMGRSKLDPGKVFNPLGVWATARNWRTVNALLDLAASR
jgi:uncharacterized protein (DUF1697 family)